MKIKKYCIPLFILMIFFTGMMISCEKVAPEQENVENTDSDDDDNKDENSDNDGEDPEEPPFEDESHHNGHEFVDLGLPSGTKWATQDLGATSPYELGASYKWGLTDDSDGRGWHYNVSSYTGRWELTDKDVINYLGILKPPFDAASVNWGGKWRIPSVDQWRELLTLCDWNLKMIKEKGIFVVTGPNGKSIELPMESDRRYSNSRGADSYSIEWLSKYGTSSLHEKYGDEIYYLYVSSIDPIKIFRTESDVKLRLRPVVGLPEEPFDYDGEDRNGHKYVDLGLPSRRKWATWNIGANSPDCKGIAIPWGGTVNSNGDNIQTYEISYQDLMEKGVIDSSGNLTNKYDAATMAWGPLWKMPTVTDFMELVDKCTWKKVMWNGDYMIRVTGPNGKCIYFPGQQHDKTLNFFLYWSSTICNGEYFSQSFIYDKWTMIINGPQVEERDRSNYGWIRAVLK